MFDGALRPKIDPVLNRLARVVAGFGVHANAVTIAGLLTGVVAAGCIAYQCYIAGLLLALISRICDGLDGAVARINGKSDFGGYIDIVFDFAFYGLIPLAFVIADPAANAIAGSVLLFSFYVNGSSFLAFAIMAEKHGLTTDQRGEKSIFFTTGLAEATETIAVFVLFCLFPAYFAPIAYIFAAVCLYTAAVRVYQTRQMLR